MPARKQSTSVRKSPRRVAGDPVPVVGPSGSPVAVAAPPVRIAYTPREFGEWFRTQTNKQHRPFQEEKILAYTNAALA
ncbi:MAG TPA: hypothetical protein VI194_16580 [Mycobacterium sp.]